MDEADEVLGAGRCRPVLSSARPGSEHPKLTTMENVHIIQKRNLETQRTKFGSAKVGILAAIQDPWNAACNLHRWN